MCVESSCNNCKLFWMPVKNLYMYSLIWFYKSLYYTYVYLLTYQYILICSGKISISFWKILIVWFIWCLFRSIIKILWKLLVSSELKSNSYMCLFVNFCEIAYWRVIGCQLLVYKVFEVSVQMNCFVIKHNSGKVRL